MGGISVCIKDCKPVPQLLGVEAEVKMIRQILRGDEWSLRAFASMPSTAIFLRARAEKKNLLCEQRAV